MKALPQCFEEWDKSERECRQLVTLSRNRALKEERAPLKPT